MKPTCKLVGEDGNIFMVVGRASRALKKAGMEEQAKIMTERVYASTCYHEALGIVMEYVDAE